MASEGVASGEGVLKRDIRVGGVEGVPGQLGPERLELVEQRLTTVLKNLVTCHEGWCHDYIIIYLSRQFMLGSRWSQSIIILLIMMRGTQYQYP